MASGTQRANTATLFAMFINITGEKSHPMSLENGQRSRQQNPPTIQQVQDQIRSTCDDIIHFCPQQTGSTFYHAEQALRINISS